MHNAPDADFILGIDLGSNSLGWALISRNQGRATGILRAGTRIFQSAMEGNMAAGREESRNRARRDARLHRRQLWRRARRLKKTLHLLQRFGLLPQAQSSTPVDRQDLINKLDESIRNSPWFNIKKESGTYPEPAQMLPYIIRAAALDEPLEPHLIGRALLHLAQRRGFRSNRKQTRAAGKTQDEEGVVKEGIAELSKDIQQSGARTLGEHFARLSPFEKGIRARWTARAMYEDEFDRIWERQAIAHSALLTIERKKNLFGAIFHQRPLKFDSSVIGRCGLERGEQRAPVYLLSSQRFRLLDRVNNLLIQPPGETECALTDADRAKLIQKLEDSGDLTFKQIRKLLGLEKDYLFNLERGGEEKLLGNRTNSEFLEAFGGRWTNMTSEERDAAVEYVHAFEKPEKLKSAAQKKWGLDDAAAETLASISLEPDYLNFSRKAIWKLLPLLEAGVPTATARKQVYPESFQAASAHDFLPPVSESLEIRNPAVIRSLTELRKVVNAIIREHGKPAEIHIELARELKKPKKAREASFKKNRDNERARKNAAQRITSEIGIPRPSRSDVRKFLLAEECRWECPYTGRQISMRSLFSEPQFDIEHIIPFSRSLDDSFFNVTLCAIDENRNRKGNKTPFEAYSGDADAYRAILDRVGRFTGDRSAAAEKLRRFKMTPEEVELRLTDFTARQLGDTAYASSLAAKYLGLLYGGTVGADGNRRVQATSGQVTAYLRNEWKLNAILDDGPTSGGANKKKSRDDHRHHAVDAIAIALTDAGTVKMLSDAARRAPAEHRKRFGSVPGPWPGFVDSVREQIAKIVVSHRVSKKVSGALHEETIYGQPSQIPKARRVRKPLSKLSKPELQEIADPSVKSRVLARLKELGTADPQAAFAKEESLPAFQARDGRRIPIRCARLEKAVPTFPLSTRSSVRHVASESNHHIELLAELDSEGNEIEWDGQVVPLARAYERMRRGVPIVQRDHGPRRQFMFSLAAGEAIECDTKPGERAMFVVRKMSQFSSGAIQIGFAPLNDARQAREMQISRSWLWASPDKLRQRHAIKILLGPLGEIGEAHD
jgi:CRISPR-associated endonuclease Csn1